MNCHFCNLIPISATCGNGCETAYCSQKCANLHWETHQFECIEGKRTYSDMEREQWITVVGNDGTSARIMVGDLGKVDTLANLYEEMKETVLHVNVASGKILRLLTYIVSDQTLDLESPQTNDYALPMEKNEKKIIRIYNVQKAITFEDYIQLLNLMNYLGSDIVFKDPIWNKLINICKSKNMRTTLGLPQLPSLDDALALANDKTTFFEYERIRFEKVIPTNDSLLLQLNPNLFNTFLDKLWENARKIQFYLFTCLHPYIWNAVKAWVYKKFQGGANEGLGQNMIFSIQLNTWRMWGNPEEIPSLSLATGAKRFDLTRREISASLQPIKMKGKAQYFALTDLLPMALKKHGMSMSTIEHIQEFKEAQLVKEREKKEKKQEAFRKKQEKKLEDDKQWLLNLKAYDTRAYHEHLMREYDMAIRTAWQYNFDAQILKILQDFPNDPDVQKFWENPPAPIISEKAYTVKKIIDTAMKLFEKWFRLGQIDLIHTYFGVRESGGHYASSDGYITVSRKKQAILDALRHILLAPTVGFTEALILDYDTYYNVVYKRQDTDRIYFLIQAVNLPLNLIRADHIWSLRPEFLMSRSQDVINYFMQRITELDNMGFHEVVRRYLTPEAYENFKSQGWIK